MQGFPIDYKCAIFMWRIHRLKKRFFFGKWPRNFLLGKKYDCFTFWYIPGIDSIKWKEKNWIERFIWKKASLLNFERRNCLISLKKFKLFKVSLFIQERFIPIARILASSSNNRQFSLITVAFFAKGLEPLQILYFVYPLFVFSFQRTHIKESFFSSRLIRENFWVTLNLEVWFQFPWYLLCIVPNLTRILFCYSDYQVESASLHKFKVLTTWKTFSSDECCLGSVR